MTTRTKFFRLAAVIAMGVAVGVLSAMALAFPPEASAADPIKQSRSGICHCPGGQYYDGVSNFTAFDSLEECLAADGREPKQGQGDCLTPLEQAEAEIVELQIRLEAAENAFARAVAREHPSAECESMLKWVAGERTNSSGVYISKNDSGNTIIHKDDVPELVRACRE